MTAPDPWLQPELRAQRRLLFTVIAMLVLLCVSLVAGWANTWNHTRTLVATAATAQSGAWQCVEVALTELDDLKLGISKANQRVYLLGSRKLLEDRNIAAPPEAGR